MATFWALSFIDPARREGDRWLGTAIIEAPSYAEAIQKAWQVGANPGGEIEGIPFLADSVHEDYVDTLVTDKQRVKDMPRPVNLRLAG